MKRIFQTLAVALGALAMTLGLATGATAAGVSGTVSCPSGGGLQFAYGHTHSGGSGNNNTVVFDAGLVTRMSSWHYTLDFISNHQGIGRQTGAVHFQVVTAARTVTVTQLTGRIKFTRSDGMVCGPVDKVIIS